MYSIQLRTIAAMLLCVSLSTALNAQHKVLLHAHNDYRQTVPFYQAYAQQFSSFEADIWFDTTSNSLVVAHDEAEIDTRNTLEELYIQPIVKQFIRYGGKIRPRTNGPVYLLIDIKRNDKQLLPALQRLLQQYPQVFQPEMNPAAVQVVLTGDMPGPEQFAAYPAWLQFDGRPQQTYTPDQLRRVAFVSDAFTRYSSWNGKGSLVPADRTKLEQLISKVHAQHKMLRLWGSPDNVNTWQTFSMMGIDIINTDRPEQCALFFGNAAKNNFQFGEHAGAQMADSIKTDRLDKTTYRFRGFSNKAVPAAPIATYTPTSKTDGAARAPRNIIVLIGDGMGVAQLSAADLVNAGLTTTKMKYTGLQRTQPKGNFITDSAGAGSALATGQKTSNRHIATDDQGKPITSLTERMYARGKRCGVVTSGNVADATPAAFYAHVTERDQADSITAYLRQQQLWVLAGSGQQLFTHRTDGYDLKTELLQHYQYVENVNKPVDISKPLLLIDEALGEAATADNLHLLAQTTYIAIQQLVNKKGFFLMVEGAKIDYAGHANSVPNCITEMLGFDLAVKEALQFADKDGGTLVIVTGDHETGGLSIIDGNVAEGRITGQFGTDDHTPVFLPVFAYGPGAQYFTGVYDNTGVFHRILKVLKHK